MKSVLISIQPKWVGKIARGEKTIEVRKTRPKLETPFKCYIYCTKNRNQAFYFEKKSCNGLMAITGSGKGKVIGEFVCDRIKKINIPIRDVTTPDMEIFSIESCLSVEKLINYIGNGQVGYGWNISDLKIYGKPKELSEFWYIDCKNKKNGCVGCKYKPTCIKNKVRPPQSYCYIEDLGE